MLEEFKNIYDIHGWLRCLTWAGLLCIALFLSWSLRLAMRGSVQLHPFLLLAALSVGWCMLCGFVLWFSLTLIRHHLKQWRILDRRRFRRVDEEWLAARESFLNHPEALYDALHPFPLAMAGNGNGFGHASGDPLAGLRLPQKQQRTREKLDSKPIVLHTSDHISEVPTRPNPHPRTPSAPGFAPVPATTTPAKSRPGRSRPRLQSQYARVGVGWNPGLKRKNAPNEDGLAAIQGTCTHRERIVPFDLFIVADGMGGHANGQEASRLAIQTMTQVVLQSVVMCGELNDASFTEVLSNGVQQANLAIWTHNREQSSDMGTTLTAALVVGTKAYVVNVGDSRTYLYRPSAGLSQITRDHSLVARLVANGVILPDEIYTHPRRNQIERSLGDKDRAQVDTFIVDLRKHDWLLLCSDGLWEMVRDPEIERIMQQMSEPAQMSETLIQAALKGGGADNVSVIVARMA